MSAIRVACLQHGVDDAADVTTESAGHGTPQSNG
jgi:hypothetical protein